MAEIDYTLPPVSLSPFDGLDVPDSYRYTYEASICGKDYLTHTWALKDDRGGIHIHGTIRRILDWPLEWQGGVEVHYASPPEYMSSDNPSHDHCWLLHKPCWHDGTSLYFSERIAPMLPNPRDTCPNHMADRHHRYIMSELISWHRDKFTEARTTDGEASYG